jgi:homoserine dehydrogenase/aspartokinase/homoserine dehydrogenase 1
MKQIPVIILGAGGVGSALIRQIVNGREQTATRNKCHFDIVAVTDSKTWLWQANGLADETLLDIVTAKQNGQAVDPQFRQTPPTQRQRPSKHGILDAISEAELDRTIIIDVSAADGMESVLKHALNLNHCVVLANKKPLAASWETAEGFYNHRRVRHESTVGGGQPVIATCRYLMDVNDPIYAIEGQMSGTLGYICNQLDEGIAFSTAVRAAKSKGFTEPDPREDLGGMDVVRKTLILARMAGWPLEESDIVVESLYPPNLAALAVPEFLDAIAEMDMEMRQRVADAANEGFVLRYMAEVAADGGRVGLKRIPATSGLANLKYIGFRSQRYDEEPLLIGGKGAGVEMTAAGVIGDMISLVREIF